MDWNRVEGNWKQMKGAVKQQWGKLTDDDLTQINGSQEKLEGIIQERYGIAKDETRKQLARTGIRAANRRSMMGPGGDVGACSIGRAARLKPRAAIAEQISGSKVRHAASLGSFRRRVGRKPRSATARRRTPNRQSAR